MRILLLMLLIAGCSRPPPLPVPPPCPPVTEPALPIPAAVAVPKQVRAALARAEPREHALAASPRSDAADIALVRELHRNVEIALATLERDGGRHVTPTEIKRARTAIKDLQNHLNEFAAAEAKDNP